MSFERTIEQYSELLKKHKAAIIDEQDDTEIVKNNTRLNSLIDAHKDFAAKFAQLKLTYNSSDARTQLFNDNHGYALDGDSVVNKRNVASTSPRTSFEHKGSGLPLYNGLQKEQSIFQRGNAQLDLILEMGHQSLDNIVEQNQIIHRLQDRMSSSLRTLGVSDETIQRINRRAFKDKLIFWFALALMLLGFYFILKWLT